MASLGLGDADGIEIHNARLSHNNRKYADFLYAPAAAPAATCARDCQRMVNQDRNVFAACMVATGDADAMVTGLTRSAVGVPGRYRPRDRPGARRHRLRPDADAGRCAARTIFIADTLMHFRPDAAATGRHRDRRRRRRAPARATSRAWRCCRTPPSATRCMTRGDADARGGGDPGRAAAWISNMTAK